MSSMTPTSTIALRVATADDADDLRRLAELDSARPLLRPAVLGVVDGRPVAAVSLRDGRIVADPFTPNADVVALLRAHAHSIDHARRSRRPSLRLPRLHPAI
jgi:hypothetical protein